MKNALRISVVLVCLHALGMIAPALSSEPTFAQLRPSAYSLYINGIPVNCYNVNGRNCVFLADLKVLGVRIESMEAEWWIYWITGYSRPKKMPSIEKHQPSRALGAVTPTGDVSIGNTGIPGYTHGDRMLIHVSDLARIGTVSVASTQIKVSLEDGDVTFDEGRTQWLLGLPHPPEENQQVVVVRFNEVGILGWAVGNWSSIARADEEDGGITEPDVAGFLDFGFTDNRGHGYLLFFKSNFDLSLDRDEIRAVTQVAAKRKVTLYMPSGDTLAFMSDELKYNRSVESYLIERARLRAKAEAKKLYAEYVSNGKRPLRIKTYSISYPSIYNAQVSFTVKNVGSKAVDSFVLRCYLYTKSGKPVSIGYRSKDNVYTLTCSVMDPGSLPSGDSASYTSGGALPSDVARVHPVITKVHFIDGSLWTP